VLSQLLRTTGDTVSQPIATWPCELVITVSGLVQEACSAQALQQAAVLKLSPFEVSIAIEGHHRYRSLHRGTVSELLIVYSTRQLL
jgi:hypothetical protein